MMERIKEIVADSLGVDVDSLTAETRFKEDLKQIHLICLKW